MTPTANARIAGFTFLFYIAAGIASLILFGRASSGDSIAAKLAAIAQHTTDMSAVIVLLLLQSFSALVLAVTLYAMTRGQDRDLAMLGMICRVSEGVIGGVGISNTLALVWLATPTAQTGLETGAAHALAWYLFRNNVALSATFFAAGSTIFSYLFLRGRMIPVALAWLGVAASLLLVLGLPLQLAGVLRGPVTSLMWLPMLAFEVPLAVWLLIKGVVIPPRTQLN